MERLYLKIKINMKENLQIVNFMVKVNIYLRMEEVLQDNLMEIN